MIRIGVVNIDTSHPLAFARYLEQGNRARYVAIYNDGFRGDDEVEAFIAKFGLEGRCNSIAELAEKVDIGFVQGCDWDLHVAQARPFVERGKPVFLDKPIVGSLADCQQLEAWAAQGACVVGSSSVRYAPEISEFLAKPASERGEMLTLYGTAGVDEFNYGVHIVEALCETAASQPLTTQFIGASTSADGKRTETFSIRFASGAQAVYTLCHGLWQPFEMVLTTTKGTFQFRIDTGRIYGALLDRICDTLETGENRLAPIPKLTEAIKAMLAGRISRETGGGIVAVETIAPDDPGYDGAAFAQGYAAAASKIYLS